MISRNTLKDKYAGEVSVKSCEACGRELGGLTTICPKCNTRQSSFEDKSVNPTQEPVEAKEFCSCCSIEVIPDEDNRCPECRWPL
ncbi:hypothetical protein RBSWK_01360 [Rhodopirellula baltica SWK14]|uniref:Uncharacterized protein n=1 Tax=Rhodopirellula baltica SWK14 TaxID=993516 RepID=L7CLK1_RHOBT|nr:hypothetical protein RBSWK_01360 [Rhodopirellula baltica SWK14]